MAEKTTTKARDRRATRRPRLSLNQILETMQNQADEEYNGNLPDNALPVFNGLHIDDRRTFLRKSLEALWEKQIAYAQQGLEEIILQGEIDINATCDAGNTKREIRINPVDVRAERDYITTSTPEEQKKFRQWLVKLMLGLMFVMFFGIIFFTAFYGEHDAKTIFQAASNINTLFELLLKVEK